MTAQSVRRLLRPANLMPSPVAVPSCKSNPSTTRYSPPTTSDDLPLSITLPGVFARKITCLPGVPCALKTIAASSHTPSLITSVSPGLAASAARTISAGDETGTSAPVATRANPKKVVSSFFSTSHLCWFQFRHKDLNEKQRDEISGTGDEENW